MIEIKVTDICLYLRLWPDNPELVQRTKDNFNIKQTKTHNIQPSKIPSLNSF